MAFLQLVIILVVTGVILWAINTFIPMNRSIKMILNAVVVIVTIVFVLRALGVIALLT